MPTRRVGRRLFSPARCTENETASPYNQSMRTENQNSPLVMNRRQNQGAENQVNADRGPNANRVQNVFCRDSADDEKVF